VNDYTGYIIIAKKDCCDLKPGPWGGLINILGLKIDLKTYEG